MTVDDIAHIMETWAPHWTAWERDNVGLQLGERTRRVRRVGVALDITDAVVDEAIRKKADLLISHHPLFFNPPKNITSDDRIGAMALRLIERRIAVFSSHTNLDSVRGGVNTTLARSLGLKKVSFLTPLSDILVKLAVFVPVGHTADIRRALSSTGAGVIGHYTSCTFNTPGVGTFKAERSAHPYIGSSGRFETADEVKVEAVVPRALLERTVAAIRAVHPYDEIAYDVYPVENPDVTYGLGAIGTLSAPTTLDLFLRRVRRVTGARHVRYSGSAATVRTVAVCGGSGSDYIRHARDAGADVYITADVRYHAHQESTRQFAIIDAGHWETEHLVLPEIAGRLRSSMGRGTAAPKVYVTRINTNPVHTS